jgi:fumarate reductase subunit D
MRSLAATRGHPAWWAFAVHRVSGLGLVLFLPVHFLALGLAIEGEATLDGFLAWTANPVAKLAETALVMLLAVHLAGGLRLLAIEFVGWTDRQRQAIAAAFGFALACALLFLLNA